MNRETNLDIREVVFNMLLRILKETEYSHIVVHQTLEKYDDLDATQKAFIKRLCEGCVEKKIQLEYVINQYSKLPLSKMKPVIRIILLMGTYQILFMDGVPDSAACNESVKLAKRRKFQNLSGFVNGILRTISREKEHISYPDKEVDYRIYLHIMYSMPLWLVDHFMKECLLDDVEQIFQDMQRPHDVSIRMDENMSEESKEAWICKIKDHHTKIINNPYLSYAYLLQQVDGLKHVPGFLEGVFTVQDTSSMLVAEIAAPRGDERVLDVCAAPGGKALHMATKLKGTGMVVARDLSEEKVQKMNENQERLQLKNISFETYDATVLDQSWIGKADIVIADLPCSGLGIMGKKRDIRYRISPNILDELPLLQKQILKNATQYVKPGGTLIYSTCTINHKENQEIADWLISSCGLVAESCDSYLPDKLKSAVSNEGYLQLLPGIHSTDGFFIARFKKE